jgi:hypothetical protein
MQKELKDEKGVTTNEEKRKSSPTYDF